MITWRLVQEVCTARDTDYRLSELDPSEFGPVTGCPTSLVFIDTDARFQKLIGFGGAFTVTLGLEKDFRERIVDTPISETGIFGAACGAALMGMRPIADVQYGDVLDAGDDDPAAATAVPQGTAHQGEVV